MLKALIAAFAAAALLSGGFLESAGAVTFATALGGAGIDLVQQASVICGTNGCSPVQTKRVQHRKPLHH
jgi:hypothetical protein